jgi:1,4-dihydroxy-2-naphthoate octaprenyltransferase
METQNITKLQAWRLAARPKTLPAAVGPVAVGTALAYADGTFAALPALAALIGSLLFQVAVNFANDYFDYIRGIDTSDRLGPVRVTASGLISPGELRVGLAAVLGAELLVGLYLVAVGGWPVLIIGVTSTLATLAYSGGPYPLASHGLGDLFVFIFFGLAAVCGTYYVQALDLTAQVVLAAVPVGTLTTAIIIVNNFRDIDTDRSAGKRTLAVMLGRRWTRVEFIAMLAIAYAVPPLFWLAGEQAWVMLPWLTLPMAWLTVRGIYTLEGRPLNKLLAQTARLTLAYCVLFAVGLAL